MKTPQYISGTMYSILEFLAKNGRARVADISRGIHISPSAVSVAIKKLHELGLVDDGQRDGVSVIYSITLRGKLLYDILSKQDFDDAELLQYWIKNVIRPRLGEMISLAHSLQSEEYLP